VGKTQIGTCKFVLNYIVRDCGPMFDIIIIMMGLKV
jgi:hypothetical protein